MPQSITAALYRSAIPTGSVFELVRADQDARERKAVADDWLDAVSGTTGLTGAANQISVLSRDRGQADAFLLGTGRDLPGFEKPLKLDQTTCRWALLEICAA